MGSRIVGIGFTVLFFVASPTAQAQGQEEVEETIGVAEVGQGSLLFRTDHPGRFVPAPMQSTEVEITIRR